MAPLARIGSEVASLRRMAARSQGPCVVYVGIRGGRFYVGQTLRRCFGDRVLEHQHRHGSFVVLRVWSCRDRVQAVRWERELQRRLGVDASAAERYWDWAA